MSTPRRSCRIAESHRVKTFTVFPKLPLELQHEIWNLAAHAEADSTPPRIRVFEPDPPGFKCELPVLDSNLRHRPKLYYPEIQLRLYRRSHSLPALLNTCRASREAAKRLYTAWEVAGGGYVYVNKERDIFLFGQFWPSFWFLRTIIGLINSDPRPYGKVTYADQVARLQYVAQLSGCQNIAFSHFNWIWVMRNPLLLLENFEGLKTVVLVLHERSVYFRQGPPPPPPPQRAPGTISRYWPPRHWPGPKPRTSRRRLLTRPYISGPPPHPPPIPRYLINGGVEMKFVVPTEKLLKAGGWTDWQFQRAFDDLRGREEELRISIPNFAAVVPASKDVVMGNWARSLAVYAI